ncbi:hypothetical protein P43SY_001835 [Pythium insidiosum]|uniref:Elicitin-like protein n=1 Tax=Pythium insidiosum TaxID=114742 RepID=A0AAD5Q930_PYTIN|nr:hypothetical protein P43SY_001835 [Pythium insidiosum]
MHMLSVPLVACALGGHAGLSHAALCSDADVAEQQRLLSTNSALFDACLGDLALPKAAADARTSFIAESFVKSADSICASERCVKALISAMETLPDCCSPAAASSARNLPRLADDILHQCDLRDARKLASELEAEIAKLPDLKVQIRSVKQAGSSSSSSHSGSRAGVGDVADVDVIIDVKKREMMKSGKLGLAQNDTDGAGGRANGAPLARASPLLLALPVVASMWMTLLL